MYKIFLADDHAIFRAGLKGLIEKDSQLKVVGEAPNGEELLLKLKSTKCDAIVLDLSMPAMDGLAAMKLIREKFPKVKILILTMQKDPEHFEHAMAGGAAGYLLKDDAYDQLILAIKLVLKGKRYISPSVATLTTDRFIRSVDDTEAPSLELLTKREKEILKFVSNSFSNKNIASRLKISVRTVETHRANLSNKLGIKSTAGLVKYAMAKGLL
ncbi:MAG: hypothetical protein A2787_01205 [Omnitrophica WOR_2 bacterium RIFCSPHIGHO2_01_FULL_48_9]|nr:MAG: hypothetical protein A2787_01205 [Omnitrophica WOR_2 bacterium RIFCSPHIGHO2_01_FULL_48_9]